MVYIAQTPDGQIVHYRDTKRYCWLASLTGPLVPLLSIVLYFWLGRQPLALFFPMVYSFGLVPLADWMFGEDTHNPPEGIVPLMAQDNYYRVLLYVGVVLQYADFVAVACFVGTQALSWWGWIALTLGTGFASGGAILLGHELGHKQHRLDRAAAQVANGLVGYGHFCTEHNRGHHVHVATPEDCASARMGETIYGFMLREIPGAFKRGWAIKAGCLTRSGKSALSLRNEILWSWALTVAIAVVLTALFGWIMIPFIAIHHAYGWYGLTQANYVEHYGLLRQRLANGRYEPPQPRHSWNTNHMYSNIISFHLQRHSDHHAHASRPYQALRDSVDLPRLPSGYPGSFALAAVPFLWFKVMNQRLLQWADGDLSKVNVDPARKEQLYAKYGASHR